MSASSFSLSRWKPQEPETVEDQLSRLESRYDRAVQFMLIFGFWLGIVAFMTTGWLGLGVFLGCAGLGWWLERD